MEIHVHTMQIHGNARKMHADPSKSAQIHGDFHGFVRILRGFPWSCMDLTWICMDLHGFYMGFNGSAWILRGFQWICMDFTWIAMDT